MTLDELNEKLDNLLKDYGIARNKAYQDYLNSNAKFNTGDIITDGNNVGIVMRNDISFYGPSVYLNYFCQKLKADGTLRKKPETFYIDFKNANKFIKKG